jgi:hypothetical protein
MHPGDNFRVAAACNQDYLNGVLVAGTSLKDAEGATLPTAGAKVTDMLTVWRSFHVEADSMGPVTGNQLAGAILKAQSSESKFTTVFTIDQSTGQANRLENGLLHVADVGDFTVIASSRSTVTVSGIPGTPQLAGRAFTLVDDDDFDDSGAAPRGDEGEVLAPTAKTFSRMRDSDDPAQNVYAPAYLRPRYDGGGSLAFNGTVPFTLNVPTDVKNVNSFNRLLSPYRNSQAAGIESDEFWVVYLQLGYQGGIANDGDPNTELIFGGITEQLQGVSDNATSEATVPGGGQGSFVFLESARDGDIAQEYNWRERSAPHEVGHQFGLKGDNEKAAFGIMNPKGPLAFVPTHLNVLRWRVKSPGMP